MTNLKIIIVFTILLWTQTAFAQANTTLLQVHLVTCDSLLETKWHKAGRAAFSDAILSTLSPHLCTGKYDLYLKTACKDTLIRNITARKQKNQHFYVKLYGKTIATATTTACQV